MNIWPWNRIRDLEKRLEWWTVHAESSDRTAAELRILLGDEERKTDTLSRLLHKYERNDMRDRAHRCRQCGYVYSTWRGVGNRPLMECPICGQHAAYDYGYEGTD